MSSWIVLDRDYAELRLSDGKLHRLRKTMLNIALRQGISDESLVIKFIKDEFYSSTYIDIVDDIIEKSEIELFGKLFLAAIEKSDAEEYFDYFEVPDDPELRSFYYRIAWLCLEPMECCNECIAQVNKEKFIKETGGIFKQVNDSARYYDFANKILEYAAKLED